MAKEILIVEDEPHIVEALSFILAREGYAVQSHSNGATALDRLQSNPPDLVVLDLMLPGRSGLQLLDDIRADGVLAELPVLMLTAKGQKKDRDAAESAGVSKFITKPFANTDIIDSVNALLSDG